MHLDQPLTDKEFDELDRFLLSDRCPEGTMTMDALNGYLTAIAIGPETILPSEWLPHVWGGAEQPKWKNDKEVERVFGLIARFLNEIVITFEVAPKDFEPLFGEVTIGAKTLLDPVAWCWGFWEGVKLRADAWEAIWDEEVGDLFMPFFFLTTDENGDPTQLDAENDPELAHEFALDIEANLPAIHKFWLPRRKPAVETVKREEPKVGRNDECPCGSGKKFKKCCGAEGE
jgi:uncharacterized protein